MELQLTNNQIDVWQTSLSLFEQNNALSELETLLTASDKQQISMLKRAPERKVKTVSRAFLRAVLAKYTGLQPTEIEFRQGLHGKPEIANAGYQLEFNLSHSDNVLACVICKDKPVGIDIERIRFKRNLKALVKSLFSESEYDEFEALSELKQEQYFYDRWTLKESLIKATGKGLTTKLSNVSFSQNDPVSSFCIDGLKLTKVSGHFFSWLWPISKQHRLAVTLLDDKNVKNTAIKFRSFHYLPNVPEAQTA